MAVLVHFGLHKGVLAYPNNNASYPVSVRQYQILQSRFLQCMFHNKPPCDLLMLRDVTPAHKGLSPSGKIRTCSQISSTKIKFVFLTFSKSFETGARCLCRAHTRAKSKRADSGNLKCIATHKIYRRLTVLCSELPASS